MQFNVPMGGGGVDLVNTLFFFFFFFFLFCDATAPLGPRKPVIVVSRTHN